MEKASEILPKNDQVWGNLGDVYGCSPNGKEIELRVSSLPIPNQTTFASLPPYAQSWTPLAAGGPESRIISALSPGVTYYVAIEAFDATGVHGSLSNIPSAMPPSLLGTISYGLYLIHQPVAGVMHGLILDARPDIATVPQVIVTFAALFAVFDSAAMCLRAMIE